MPDLLRNILAVLAGLVAGSVVNMAIVLAGPMVVEPPPGVDLSTPAGLAQGMPLLGPQHFAMPFLAHALGTLVGALTALALAATRKALAAFAVGALFLCGGVAAATMIPAPAWFIALDLVAAYLPMAWLAVRLGSRAPGEVAGH